jgi:hypothetical protein
VKSKWSSNNAQHPTLTDRAVVRTPHGSRANGCTAAPSSVILTPFTLSLPHTSTMMMISNMKSDQAKFNIEINNDKKFEQPNFDQLCGGSNPAWFSDCQEKGKNRYSKTQQQQFHL